MAIIEIPDTEQLFKNRPGLVGLLISPGFAQPNLRRQHMPIWQDLSQFPESTREWQIQRSGRILEIGEQRVRKFATRWFLAQKKLVSTPNTDRFIPSICVPELSSFTHETFLKKFRLLIYLTFFYFLAVLSLALISDNSGAFNRVIAFLALVLLLTATEYKFAFKSYRNIVDRCLYFHWITNQRNLVFEATVAAFCSIGIFQFAYLNSYGDLESLITKYGTFFPAIEEGQIWRYFTGPFFHSGLAHWFANTFMFFFLVKHIGKLGNGKLILLLFFSIPLSAIAAHFFSTSSNGFVGLSGAVFFLFGWLTGISYREDSFFPKHYGISFSIFTAVYFLLPIFFSHNTSYMAHLSGFTFGILVGWLKIGSDIEQYKEL